MTRRRLLREMDAAELEEWRAYERIDGPLGPRRLDHAIARLLAWYFSAKSGDAQNPERYMPEWITTDDAGEPPEPQCMPEEEQRQQVDLILQAWGKK